VAHRAQPADDGGGAAGPGVVDGESVEGADLDAAVESGALADEVDPLLDAEQRRLPRVLEDGDDQLVDDQGGTLENVEMRKGDRVEASRIDRHMRRRHPG